MMPQHPLLLGFESQYLTTPTDFFLFLRSFVSTTKFPKIEFPQGERETFSEPICAFEERNGPPRANESLTIVKHTNQHMLFPYE